MDNVLEGEGNVRQPPRDISKHMMSMTPVYRLRTALNRLKRASERTTVDAELSGEKSSHETKYYWIYIKAAIVIQINRMVYRLRLINN
jgi:hypothetical protein